MTATLGLGGSVRPLLAHAGGIDEMLFVLFPLLVFLVLQWLSRRKEKIAPDAEDDAEGRLERRRRLAGGLVADTPRESPKEEDPPGGIVS